jgi:hypothetical protein
VFARVKKSRDSEYLQIVENYRDGDRVRQRLVLYVGHGDSLEDALKWMPRDVGRLRCRATRSERFYEDTLRWAWSERDRREAREWAEHDRHAAEELASKLEASKLEALRRLVKDHPDLLERDRGRAERHRKRAN